MTVTLEAILASHLHPDALHEHLAPWSDPIGRNVVVMRSNASKWLLDLPRSRFQHVDVTADTKRFLLHGTWTGFTELAFYPADAILVIEPQTGPPLLTHIRPIPPIPPTAPGLQQGVPPPT